MDNDARASSSALDAKQARKQVRKRTDKVAYSLPSHKKSKFAISTPHAPALEPALNPLARALFLFDLSLIRRVYAFHDKQRHSEDESHKIEANRWIEEYIEIKHQWKNIELGQGQFTQSYMEDRYFIPFWTEGLRIVKDALRDNRTSTNAIEKRSVFTRILTEYEKLACSLQEKLIDASRQGLLEKGVIISIQDRWVKLEEVLRWYYDSRNALRDEDSAYELPIAPTWAEVRCLVEESAQQASNVSLARKDVVGVSTNSTRTNKAILILGLRIDIAFVLWLILFICIVVSIALFALGYACSPHSKGTTSDADFWFLTQAAVMQCLGLCISALREGKNMTTPVVRWALLAVVAAICSLTAIPLYLVAPTEWSSFLSLTATATQTFMVLQHFLSR